MSSCSSVVRLASFRSCSFFWVSDISFPHDRARRPNRGCEDGDELQHEQAHGHSIRPVRPTADQPGQADENRNKAETKSPDQDAAKRAVRLADLVRHPSRIRPVRSNDYAAETEHKAGEGGGGAEDGKGDVPA